jgi:myo-inositol-1-phosphate synthase
VSGPSVIKTAIVGVGNCASSLVQGLWYCRSGEEVVSLPFPRLGGYEVTDIEIVAAFDIDDRKVGRDLSKAIFAPPNCTYVFHRDVPVTGVTVCRGPTLDGVAPHMNAQPPHSTFIESAAPALDEAEIVRLLKAADCQVMINFLPVGAQKAAEMYATCALAAGVAFVNAIPVFLASDPAWAARFKARGLPILGDDFKAQLGATVLHRALVSLFELRGVALDRTYQLNVGGNTDFLNMTDGSRLTNKRHSKTESVQTAGTDRIAADDIRVGPSDYVPWLNDQKVGYVRLEGRLFGGAPVNLEVRLSVEDSPNAAAMALSAIRCARIALDRGLAGAIWEPCAFLFKHPPRQMNDRDAHDLLLAFAGEVGQDG